MAPGALRRFRDMIDLHSHILPGLDDGAATLADSIAIGRAALADGVRAIAATPHVREDYPTTTEAMAAGVAAVREAFADAGLALDVLPGSEIAVEYLGRLPPADRRGFGLGGNPNVLLVEFPYDSWPLYLAEHLSSLFETGVRPVLAHPERNPDVQSAPGRLAGLVQEGALVQVTASSLVGAAGRSAQRTARQLVDTGLAHLVASDVHSASGSRVGLSKARSVLHDEALGRWLTETVPDALVHGEELPDRPRSRGRSLRRRFLDS